MVFSTSGVGVVSLVISVGVIHLNCDKNYFLRLLGTTKITLSFVKKKKEKKYLNNKTLVKILPNFLKNSVFGVGCKALAL